MRCLADRRTVASAMPRGGVGFDPAVTAARGVDRLLPQTWRGGRTYGRGPETPSGRLSSPANPRANGKLPRCRRFAGWPAGSHQGGHCAGLYTWRGCVRPFSPRTSPCQRGR